MEVSFCAYLLTNPTPSIKQVFKIGSTEKFCKWLEQKTDPSKCEPSLEASGANHRVCNAVQRCNLCHNTTQTPSLSTHGESHQANTKRAELTSWNCDAPSFNLFFGHPVSVLRFFCHAQNAKHCATSVLFELIHQFSQV